MKVTPHFIRPGSLAVLILLAVGSTTVQAQETHHYTIKSGQPSALVADAGDDITALKGEMVILAMDPVASGGMPPYTFAWTPTEGLSDSAEPTPEVEVGASEMTYTLTVTDAVNCMATDDVKIIVETITAIRPDHEMSVRVYPNPAGSWLHIDVGNATDGTISLMNNLGAQLMTRSTGPGENRVDVRSLARGTYLLILRHGNVHQTFRIIIP